MDDLISRQAAIDAIMGKPAWHGSDGSYYYADDIRDALEAQPVFTCDGCRYDDGSSYECDICIRQLRRDMYAPELQ